VTIRWLSWWDSTYGKAYLDSVQDRFTQKTGIKVERVDTPWGSMFDTMASNVQQKPATYDVLGMEGCCFLAALDKLGAVEPLDSYMQKDADFIKGISNMSPLKWLGRTMMLNWYVFPYSYTYNVDMYQKAGLKPPTNWAEMVANTKKLKDSGVAKYGFVEGFSGEGHHVIYYMFGGRLAQLGGRFYDDNGKVVFNSPEGVQALQDWKDFYSSGLMMEGAISLDDNAARQAIAAGTAAAMFDGPFAQAIATQAGSKVQLAFAPPWTDPKTGSGGYQWAGSGLSIASNSAHKDEAWQFIKWLLSDDITKEMTKNSGIWHASNAAFDKVVKTSDSPILKQLPAMLAQDPKHNLFLNPIPEDAKLNRALLEAIQAVMLGDTTPKQALDDAAAIWQDAFDTALKAGK
jgi:ABC-type glycerol-3-phosphate transport system substrate-binding protein